MSLARVHNFSVSLDGFSAGADQGPEAPFGHAGQRLVRWFTGTRSFHVMTGQEGGSTGIDDAWLRCTLISTASRCTARLPSALV